MKNQSFVLRERIETYGMHSLDNAEMLSLLTGISVHIIRKAITDFGMLDVGKYLNALDITKVQKKKLELLGLYHKRMLTSDRKQKHVINSSTKAGEFAVKLFTDRAYECFYAICLDSQNRVNKAVAVHEGTINEAPVYPRLIVETVLNYRANSVILSHNHPGGSLTPSQADIDVTKKLEKALKPIGVKIVDHIIVADGHYTSFAERGYL